MRFIEQHLEQLGTGFELVSNVAVESAPEASEVEAAGTRYLNVSSTDVLGIFHDARFRETLVNSVRRSARTVASRENPLRQQLEARLAALLGVEAVCLLSRESLWVALSGFHGFQVLADSRSSLASGAPRFRTIDELEARIEKQPAVVFVDAAHPMSGDLSPLNRISEIVRRHQSSLVVYDSTFGILGARGLGATEHLGCTALTDLLLADLSHLAAVPLVAICGLRSVCTRLARIAPTDPSLVGLATLGKALDILEAEPHRRTRLYDTSEQVLVELHKMGFDTGPSVTSWIPIWLADSALAQQWLQSLAEQRIAVRGALKLGQSRLLLSLPATLTDGHVAQLLSALEKTKRKHGVPASNFKAEAPVVSRPGTFVTSRAAAPHWYEGEAAAPGVTERGVDLKGRLMDALDTVTWRASNIKPKAIRAAVDVEVLRSFFTGKKKDR